MSVPTAESVVESGFDRALVTAYLNIPVDLGEREESPEFDDYDSSELDESESP